MNTRVIFIGSNKVLHTFNEQRAVSDSETTTFHNHVSTKSTIFAELLGFKSKFRAIGRIQLISAELSFKLIYRIFPVPLILYPIIS